MFHVANEITRVQLKKNVLHLARSEENKLQGMLQGLERRANSIGEQKITASCPNQVAYNQDHFT